MQKIFILFVIILTASIGLAEEINNVNAINSENTDEASNPNTIFDDKMLLTGYAEKFKNLPKETILEMIKDDTLSSYQIAAAIRVFKNNYSQEAVSLEKRIAEKILLRRLNRTDSPFIQVEIMHTLCRMDRYRYFESMVPVLIQKLDHYNATVNEITYESIQDIIGHENKRQREARIVFNTLRKILFLTRNRLAKLREPTPRLKQKLDFLRWSIKVLGSQELNKLPKEVIRLL